jgi:cytochrome c
MAKHDWLVMGAATVLTFCASAAHAADPAEGEKIFKRVCSACHNPTAEGTKKLGPTLFGVVGRHSGSVEGFRYSEGNKKANLVWTPEVLDKYLVDPKATVPGTTMAFAGLKKDEERKNVVAYLQTLK